MLAVTLVIVVGALMMSGSNAKGALGTNEEYKVLTSQTFNAAELDKFLNDYAKQGWRVRTGGWGNGFAFIILSR